jgi:hypothetical protein
MSSLVAKPGPLANRAPGAGALNGYVTVNMLFPMTGHAITLLANSAPHHRWDRGGTALAIYNAPALGPTLASTSAGGSNHCTALTCNVLNHSGAETQDDADYPAAV